jgi:hypothetical protein
MKAGWHGFQKAVTSKVKQLGRKITPDNMKVLGRKIKNTVRDVAGYVAPIAHGVSTIAGMAGHPEIAATAAGVSAAAHRLKD